MVTPTDQHLVFRLAETWGRLERRLDGSLATIKGISFREYRMLRTIADAPGGSVSRVDLADAVDLTPSGATRALRPLEKLGFVETVRGERDARLALASLTASGRELVSDASAVLDDALVGILARTSRVADERGTLVELLEDLGHRS